MQAGLVHSCSVAQYTCFQSLHRFWSHQSIAKPILISNDCTRSRRIFRFEENPNGKRIESRIIKLGFFDGQCYSNPGGVLFLWRSFRLASHTSQGFSPMTFACWTDRPSAQDLTNAELYGLDLHPGL